MSEIDTEENKIKEMKQKLPDINVNKNIPQLKDNIINNKENNNSSRIIQKPKESELHFPDKLFETENSKQNNESNIKEKEKEKENLKLDAYINNNKKMNNIMDNINSLDNKLYFTETYIESSPHKDTIKKIKNNKLNMIEVIPEHNKTKFNSIMLSPNKSSKGNKTKFQNKIIFNGFGPEAIPKKTIINKYNFLPLQHKIKEVKEQIKKQNNYDFEKTMRDLKIKYEQKMKKKKREKLLNEKNEKFKNKLKQMEEIRENIINQKLEKLMKRKNKQNLKKKISNKSFDFLTNEKTEKNNINKNNQNTLGVNSSDKEEPSFPSIQNMSRLEYVKLKKQKSEEDFCFQVQQKLQENEEIHKRNYLRHLRSINRKISYQEKLYRQRSYNCLEKIKMKNDKFKENYIKKEMLKSYTINKILAKARYNKKIKLNEIQIKNNYVKENQELIEKQMEEKFWQYQKKLIEQNNYINKKLSNLNYTTNEKMQKKLIFDRKQKQNLKNLNKEMSEYYNDIILRHEDNLMVVNDLEKRKEKIIDKVVKTTIEEQTKKNKEYENLRIFGGKMKNKNINNLSEEKVKKLFKQRRIEEQKKLEVETDIYNL